MQTQRVHEHVQVRRFKAGVRWKTIDIFRYRFAQLRRNRRDDILAVTRQIARKRQFQIAARISVRR